MKIAISATGQGLEASVDPRFGRAPFLIIVETDAEQVVDVIDNSTAQEVAHGAGISAATVLALAGVEAVLTGHLGPKAFAVLEAAGIQFIPVSGGTVGEVVQRFRRGEFAVSRRATSAPHQGMRGGFGRGSKGRGMA